MNDYFRNIITEENIQVCLEKQSKMRIGEAIFKMTSSFFPSSEQFFSM